MFSNIASSNLSARKAKGEKVAKKDFILVES